MAHSIDVIIIGAGMAGLTAAIELQQHGINYVVLEAQGHIGGRAAYTRTPSGLAVDLGAHWLHGKDNPLQDMLKKYNLPYDEDKADQLHIYEHGKMKEAKASEWIEKAINQKLATQIKSGEIPDREVPALAIDEESRQMLARFSAMWDGLDPPLQPSALEFLTDENTPGGLQPLGGLEALFEHMMQEIGPDRIFLKTPVSSVCNTQAGIEIRTLDGKSWKGRTAIFTASLGVIKSGLVTFEPSISDALQKELAQIAMGKMNKIIIEMAPDFFRQRNISKNLSLELLDGPAPHFCHVHSAGKPLINLFISGTKAAEIEAMSEDAIIEHLRRTLAPVEELSGFEAYIIGKPIVSSWISNPYTQGAYSACVPGGKRSGPYKEGNIFFAGDTFDKQFPGSLAGASCSGKSAALLIELALNANT